MTDTDCEDRPTIINYDRFVGLGRGQRGKLKDKFDQMPIPPFSQMLAERVTGKSHQDAVLLVVGPRGSGKSHFALNLAWKTAQKIAAIRDKDPEQWLKYFDMERNVAVISGEHVVQTMQNIQYNAVQVLDDVGAGAWSARTFMSRENRDLNAILQVCRTQRAVLIFSVPIASLIDTNISKLAAYFCEMAESNHAKGIVTVKVFQSKPLHRSKQMIYPYLRWNGQKIVRVVSGLPPKEMVDKYMEVRTQQAQAIQDKRQTEQETPRKNNRGEVWQERVKEYGDEIIKRKKAGQTVYKIGQELGLHQYTVIKIDCINIRLSKLLRSRGTHFHDI